MNDQAPPEDVPTGDVPPGPVPTGFGVVTVQNGAGDSQILLRVSTPMGVGFYFLEPEVAIQVGNALQTNGKANLDRRPKLVTPSSGLVVPELRR